MWPKLKRQIAVEREQLDQLRHAHRPLVVKCVSQTPNIIEISAVAAMLHAFYTGVENIFKRVAIECNRNLPSELTSGTDRLEPRECGLGM